MKPNHLISILLFLTSYVLAFGQEIALKNEISIRNNIVYFKGKAFTGKVYEYNPNANTSCKCTEITNYTNGLPDGESTKWYATGIKKYEGLFANGKKEGLHKSWTATGKPEKEASYLKDGLIEETVFYPSGNKKEFKKYEMDDNLVTAIKSIKEYADDTNNTLLKESNYRNLKPQGVQRTFDRNGQLVLEEEYNRGLFRSSIAYTNGKKSKVKQQLGLIRKIEEYRDDGTLISSGYLNPQKQKDSLWLTYRPDGTKDKEMLYKNEKIVEEGQYKNNEKDGVWTKQSPGGNSITKTTYENGKRISSQTFNRTSLVKNALLKPKSSLYRFKDTSGTNELVVIYTDPTENNTIETTHVYGTLLKLFANRFEKVNNTKAIENEVVDKKIELSNIDVTYKVSTYNKSTGGTEKGYDAFIEFSLKLMDNNDEVIIKKNFKVNQSDKLVNALFNSLASTYARNKKIAFSRTLKEMDISEFLATYFTIPSDIKD